MELRMIKLAIIGTNWITERFLNAALLTEQYALSAVYSRSEETGRQFASKFDCEVVFTEFGELCSDESIDAVYIASPNSFHCQQAIALMNSGKHVICEKPLASNYDEVQKMFQAAEENQVVLFEAFKTDYLPNFNLIKQRMNDIAPVRKAVLNYCQYSSRYQKYLNGENPNTFNPEFSNGSAMDIGYYCVASAISLFGEPERVSATAIMLDSGVDGQGSMLFEYNGFDVVILHSKIADSAIPSEIQGEKGNLIIHALSDAEKVEFKPRGELAQDITLPSDEQSMRYEAEFFVQLVREGKADKVSKQRSLSTAKILTEVRKQIGLVYPADS